MARYTRRTQWIWTTEPATCVGGACAVLAPLLLVVRGRALGARVEGGDLGDMDLLG